MVVIKIGRGATQRIIWILALLILAGGLTVAFFHLRDKIFPSTTFELNDELGGNIFPSLILSTATTDTLIVAPTEKGTLGNPKSGISIQITSPVKAARLHVEVAETPFFKRSVSTLYAITHRPSLSPCRWKYKSKTGRQANAYVLSPCAASMNGSSATMTRRTAFTIRESCLPHT